MLENSINSRKTRRIAVHLHMFYLDMWPEMRRYLDSLAGYSYDLFVTMVKEDDVLRCEIENYHSGASIRIVENRGYDVGPFIDFIHRIDLDNYSYIIKIHTKRFVADEVIINGRNLSGNKWRNALLTFLESPERVQSILDHFEQRPKTGMVGSGYCLLKRDLARSFTAPTKKEVCRLGWNTVRKEFIAGTMFIVRAELLKPIIGKISFNDFQQTFPGIPINNKSIAHIYERVLCFLVWAQGYEIEDAELNMKKLRRSNRWKQLIYDFRVFFYQSRITKSRHRLVKILKIPVYRKRVDVSPAVPMKKTEKIKYLFDKASLFKQFLFGQLSRSQYKANVRWLRELKYAVNTDHNPDFPKEALEGSWRSDRERDQKFHRVGLFASFNSSSKVDDTLIYYLMELKKTVDAIIFVADNPLLDGELDRIKPYIDYALYARHGEYDFGSYKRAYLLAEEVGLLNDTNELVFCNDSCLGPLKPLNDFFERFNGSDFYGITLNKKGYILGDQSIEVGDCPHIQSYFFVLGAKIFKTDWFRNFITSVKHENNKIFIITRYEQGLSKLITDHGFAMQYWFHPDEEFVRNPTDLLWRELIRDGFFLKKFLYQFHWVNLDELNEMLKYVHYPFYVAANGQINATTKLESTWEIKK